MMRGFIGAVTEMAREIAPHRESGYKPTYLKDERGYMKTGHLLTKVYTEVGMLGFAGMHRKVMAKKETVTVVDGYRWREEWFGPSAARWAMQPTGMT